MDRKNIEAMMRHYDSHSNQHQTQDEALRARREGPSFPLKVFHNEVKRQLINRFASGVPRLLDLACGRGGDIKKWIDAGVGYVKGLDLSPGEIAEARKRFEETARRLRGLRLRAQFLQISQLGQAVWRDEQLYDVVTCMFALHYFFASEHALNLFLETVAANLKDGGYFFGTVPDGKRVNETLRNTFPRYEGPLLRVTAKWTGQPAAFGSPYFCAIGDTVTAGSKESEGSVEYLAYFKILAMLAAKHGLKPVIDYESSRMEGLFDEADAKQPFKHFKPHFPDSDVSLSHASALNAAFVFQKTSAAQGKAPPLQSQAAAASQESAPASTAAVPVGHKRPAESQPQPESAEATTTKAGSGVAYKRPTVRRAGQKGNAIAGAVSPGRAAPGASSEHEAK